MYELPQITDSYMDSLILFKGVHKYISRKKVGSHWEYTYLEPKSGHNLTDQNRAHMAEAKELVAAHAKMKALHDKIGVPDKAEKKGRGRPAGAKNKKTIIRDKKIASGEIKVEPTRRRGRPAGAKNKKTVEREAKQAKMQAKNQPKTQDTRGLAENKHANMTWTDHKAEAAKIRAEADSHLFTDKQHLVEGLESQAAEHEKLAAEKKPSVKESLAEKIVDADTKLNTAFKNTKRAPNTNKQALPGTRAPDWVKEQAEKQSRKMTGAGKIKRLGDEQDNMSASKRLLGKKHTASANAEMFASQEKFHSPDGKTWSDGTTLFQEGHEIAQWHEGHLLINPISTRNPNWKTIQNRINDVLISVDSKFKATNGVVGLPIKDRDGREVDMVSPGMKQGMFDVGIHKSMKTVLIKAEIQDEGDRKKVEREDPEAWKRAVSTVESEHKMNAANFNGSHWAKTQALYQASLDKSESSNRVGVKYTQAYEAVANSFSDGLDKSESSTIIGYTKKNKRAVHSNSLEPSGKNLKLHLNDWSVQDHHEAADIHRSYACSGSKAVFHESVAAFHNAFATEGGRKETTKKGTQVVLDIAYKVGKLYEKAYKSVAKSFNEAMDLFKGGEGSRGGKIIGHTKSNKPIYADSHKNHAGFTAQDHFDAGLAQHTQPHSSSKQGKLLNAIGNYHYKHKKMLGAPDHKKEKTQGVLDNARKLIADKERILVGGTKPPKEHKQLKAKPTQNQAKVEPKPKAEKKQRSKKKPKSEYSHAEIQNEIARYPFGMDLGHESNPKFPMAKLQELHANDSISMRSNSDGKLYAYASTIKKSEGESMETFNEAMDLFKGQGHKYIHKYKVGGKTHYVYKDDVKPHSMVPLGDTSSGKAVHPDSPSRGHENWSKKDHEETRDHHNGRAEAHQKAAHYEMTAGGHKEANYHRQKAMKHLSAAGYHEEHLHGTQDEMVRGWNNGSRESITQGALKRRQTNEHHDAAHAYLGKSEEASVKPLESEQTTDILTKSFRKMIKHESAPECDETLYKAMNEDGYHNNPFLGNEMKEAKEPTTIGRAYATEVPLNTKCQSCTNYLASLTACEVGSQPSICGSMYKFIGGTTIEQDGHKGDGGLDEWWNEAEQQSEQINRTMKSMEDNAPITNIVTCPRHSEMMKSGSEHTVSTLACTCESE